VVRITNFDAVDEVRWKNVTASQVSVSSQGTNVTMVANVDGVISSAVWLVESATSSFGIALDKCCATFDCIE
jgi:hypothetical protein